MNFSVEDKLDTAKFNHVLWMGTMDNKPYPTIRSGLDLRANRADASQPEQQMTEKSQPVSGISDMLRISSIAKHGKQTCSVLEANGNKRW